MEPESLSLKTNPDVKLLRGTADLCGRWSSISPAQALITTLAGEQGSCGKGNVPPQCGPVESNGLVLSLEPTSLFRILKGIISKNNPNVMGAEVRVYGPPYQILGSPFLSNVELYCQVTNLLIIHSSAQPRAVAKPTASLAA